MSEAAQDLERPAVEQKRVAHEPPHRRAWIAHTYDCASCGYWKHLLTGPLARPELCATGAKLLAESRASEAEMPAP